MRPARPAGRTGSDEYHSGSLPIAQEAAVLFSANHADAATALLNAEIKDPVGRNNKQAWLMLFDLHQVARNREAFDSLSMLFTVKFEQSPPVWGAEDGDSASDPRRNQSRERKDFFALKPAPTGELMAEIDKLLGFAEGQGTVRLDVAKVAALTAQEALRLASVLVQLRKKQMPMWFNNVESLEKVLRAAINEGALQDQKPYWLLLFELLILQGRMDDFEELGMEFAVAFEMSPPIWEVYVNKVAQAAKATATANAPARPAAEEGFELKGVLSLSSANQIADLNAHAAARPEVVVDMSRLLRIDFSFTAAFFDVVKSIQLAGKRVILAELNEINAALLEALGVNRYAILVRRKAS
ncbi:MAG TPA: STAS domain-containing protein [Usitatibacter sp.]|nr:STAS domain-containing protein [Usitatibacter sp.]